MMKINFKQPKYIFPLVVFVPLCALVYFVMQTFGGGGDTRQTVATDRINMELPEANAEEAGDKMTEIQAVNAARRELVAQGKTIHEAMAEVTTLEQARAITGEE